MEDVGFSPDVKAGLMIAFTRSAMALQNKP
jgi:hypothetical protein